SSRRRHTRFSRDWSSDVCSSDLKSVSGTFLVQIKFKLVRPPNLRAEGAGWLQFEPSITRRQGLNCKFAGASSELNAGRWCRQQLHTIPMLLQLLMNVPPEHDFYLGMPVYNLPEIIAILQADFLHPVRMNIHRVVMQAHHGGQLRMLRQRAIEKRQLGL